MNRPRPTIAGWMALSAFAAINAALARASLVDREFFEAILLIAVAFQVGLVGILRCRGRARRFWIGFEVAGAVGLLALIAAEAPGTTGNGWVSAYTATAIELAFACLPEPLSDLVEEYQGRFLAVLYFVPLLLAAIAGGAIAAVATRSGRRASPSATADDPAPVQAPGHSHPSTPDQSRS